MPPIYNLVISTSSWLTLVALAFAVLLLTGLFFRKSSFLNNLGAFVSTRAIEISFVLSLAAMAGSLVFSNVLGYEPCNLCWAQRIFMFPLPIIFAVAWFKKDRGVFAYALPLLAVGVIIALYQTYLQFGGYGILPCSATAASCTKLYFLEFGFVTIPTMSLVAFVLLILVGVYGYKFNKVQ